MRIKFHPGRILARLWRDFTVPALLCAVIFILGSIQPFLDMPVTTPAYQQLSSIIGACVIGMVLATAVCTLIRKPLIARLASLAAAGVGAAAYLLTEDDNLAAGLMLAGIALCFWGACGKTKAALRLNQIIGWFFTCLGLSLVMYIALMLISSAVTGLFFNDLSYRITGGISTSIAYFSFLLFAPWLFLGGLPDEDTPADKRVAFVKFKSRVLLPLSLALMAVLLVYVGKIVVTWTMPVGTMNGYALAAMALFTFFHLTLTGSENVIARFFKAWGAWLMLPVLVAQQVGVWMRVDAYGLTEARVLGMVFTLLCAGVVVTALLRKQARWFFPAAAVMALIFIASPVHAGHLAMWDQIGRLESALERNGMLAEDGSIVANPDADEADQVIIWSSMDYVLDHADDAQPIAVQMRRQLCEIDGREYQENTYTYFSLSSMKELVGFAKPGSKTSNWYWIFNGTASQTALSVSRYDYAKWISVYDYRASDDTEDESAERDARQALEASHYTFHVMDVVDALSAWEAGSAAFPEVALPAVIDGEKVDLRQMLTSLEETTEPTSTYDRSFTVMQDKLTLPSGRVFHLEELSINRYENSSYTSYYVRFSGWLLTPEVE